MSASLAVMFLCRLNNSSLSLSECIRRTWATEGVKGFYRGLSASYAGIFETVLYFTFYERLKVRLIGGRSYLDSSEAEFLFTNRIVAETFCCGKNRCNSFRF